MIINSYHLYNFKKNWRQIQKLSGLLPDYLQSKKISGIWLINGYEWTGS
jgi:hypothetical protein